MKTLPRMGLLFIFCWCYQASALAASTCRTDIPESTPTAEFDLSAMNGTVVHNATGLMWSRCSLGQTWNNGDSSLAGFTDWRLPNIKELMSIVESRCFDPAINETVFPNTAFSPESPYRLYWSASNMGVEDLVGAWEVNFQFGSNLPNGKSAPSLVRLVRGGQLFDSFDTAKDNSQTVIDGSDPNPSEVGQTVTVFFTVLELDGVGIPTGQVTVTDGSVSCIGTLTAGSGNCDLVFATPGTKTLTADYPGDDNFNPSSSEAFQHQVYPQGIKNIPTLSQWAMIFLSLLLGVLGMSRVKRSRN